MLASFGMAADRSQTRSVVYSTGGIASTSHVLASQAGAEALGRGGTAVDAAIAANAVLSVVEPMACGPGGDMFLLYWEAKSGKLYGLNASGWAPQGLSAEWLRGQGHTAMPAAGIHSVTVPGAVEGWSEAHARFGRLQWKDLFGAAIRLAREGHPVHEVIAAMWEPGRLEANAEARRVFLPAPKAGAMFRNPDMARTFERIAEGGRKAFYEGPLAEAIVAASKKLGGTMAAGDLAEYRAEWVEPVSTTYRGWRVWELPPNGQGMAALMMLNLMEQFPAPAAGPHSAKALHWKIEAMKLAYADLMAYNADPRFAKVPVAGLLSKEYARERAKLIDFEKANCEARAGRPMGSDTTYLAVVDGEGNIASWIQSVRAAWGSGVVAEGTGFVLQNRGSDFVLTAGHPNELKPRKRSFHTIIPALMEKGDLRIGFGIMGGPNQPLAHAQFVSNYVDYGMNIQAALEAPRFTKNGPAGCDVQVEGRVPAGSFEGLKARGHVVERRGDFSTNMGRGSVVVYDRKTGVKQGAADPRGDGAAVPAP